MQDKKVIALIILTVLAVISLIYGVTAPAKGRAKKTAISETQTVTASRTAAVPQGIMSTRRHAKRSQFKSWKRSPFAPIPSETKPAELVLNGIIWNKAKPKAMIGDAIVVKGDTIGANKVIDIKPDRVILNDGVKDFELKLEK